MTVYVKKQALEEFLARKNLSQEEFANMLGITRPYLSMLKASEKYDVSPSPELREKMLKFLEVEFDHIFFIHNGRFNKQNENVCKDGQPTKEGG